MQIVNWRELQGSDASNCDECNRPFKGGEVRLLGEYGDAHQAVVHQGCKSRWEKRTGYIDVDKHR